MKIEFDKVEVEKDGKPCNTEDVKCKKECTECGCSLHIKIGGDKQDGERTDLQEFYSHLANIFWILFLVAVVFSWGTPIIIITFLAALVFEEFD